MFEVTFADGHKRTIKHEGTAIMTVKAEPGSHYMPIIDFNEMSKKELQALATKNSIVGRSKMTKDQLIAALKESP